MNVLEIISQNDQWRLQLQQQLHKDFEQLNLGFNEEFNEQILSLESLYAAVQDRVIKLLEQGERPFLQLLYRVDIPEHKFLSMIGKPYTADLLVNAIIHREAEKIYFRHKYRS